MRDGELMNRANAYAHEVVETRLRKVGVVKAAVARMRPEYTEVLNAIARAFVIGFAAGMEDVASPSSALDGVRVRRRVK